MVIGFRAAIALLVSGVCLACRESTPDRGANVDTGLGVSVPSWARQYVGLEHGPLPSTLTWQSGALLEPLGGREYGLAWITAPDGDMLWLNQRIDSGGSLPTWRTLAVLPIPVHDRTESVVYGQCRRAGALDTEILALVVTEDVPWYRTVRRAWRANRAAGEFTDEPTTGIECANEGYGVG